jgi:hypothetical protein
MERTLDIIDEAADALDLTEPLPCDAEGVPDGG